MKILVNSVDLPQNYLKLTYRSTINKTQKTQAVKMLEEFKN